jgi:hypothetical protein
MQAIPFVAILMFAGFVMVLFYSGYPMQVSPKILKYETSERHPYEVAYN